jgi:alkaline phosphatase D
MTTRMDRRRFLQLTAASLAVTPFMQACGTDEKPGPKGPPPVDADAFDHGTSVAFSPEAVAVDEARFACGVQAGNMRSTADGASLLAWTALDVESSDLRLRVWRESDNEGEVVLVTDVAATADADGFVKVAVDGLAPSTWYSYAFFVGDDVIGSAAFTARSAIGRVRTAFAVDWLTPVTIAATTCTKADNAPFTALERLAEQDADLFVHLGDMVYADGSSTREDYRAHWRASLTDPGYRALLAKQGGYFVWDDHEFDNNLDPETLSTTKLENAEAEFYANLPMAKNDQGKLWQSWAWGKTVEIFALDCRTERLPSTMGTDAPVYLSPEQMAWLKASLKASTCHFKVILNSVPMTRMSDMWPHKGDRWQGYEVPRQELLDFLEENQIENVWFLSGDFHVGFVARVEPTGYAKNIFEAAVGPGGNLGNPLGYLATQDGYQEQIFPSDQFLYGAGKLAATTLTFDPIEDRVHVKYVGVDGDVLFDQKIKKS